MVVLGSGCNITNRGFVLSSVPRYCIWCVFDPQNFDPQNFDRQKIDPQNYRSTELSIRRIIDPQKFRSTELSIRRKK